MPRGEQQPSVVFQNVLKHARDELLLADAKATSFDHTVIRGDERAAALANFLRNRLPRSLAIGKGEAIDYKDNRTGQLDLIIYDQARSSPVTVQQENLLVPAESLFAVIEVKSILTQVEWHKCYLAADKVRKLRPFKHNFIGPRKSGKPIKDKDIRCMYLLFAYSSNLVELDWLQKEYDRAALAANRAMVDIDIIDRAFIINCGLINPPYAKGLIDRGSDTLFLDFYVNLVNFLYRELPRRRPIDWQMYSQRTTPGWKSLK